MTLRERAAKALDDSLHAETMRVGVHVPVARGALAAWLDGAVRLKAATVREYVNYLNMIVRTASRRNAAGGGSI